MKIIDITTRAHFVALLLLLLTAALCPPCPADAALFIGSNSFTKCVQQSYSAVTRTVCTPRQAVNVGVSNGVTAVLMANYSGAAGRGSVAETLKVSKSMPSWVYPLRYLHTVDYAPKEELVKVVNSRPGIASCVDASDAVAPTCGWQLNGGGSPIADSQGFCSNRDLLQLQNCGPGDAWWRGEKELGAQSTLTDSFSIGHCLRQSGVKYRGYEIDPPVREFDISGGVYSGETLLSPFALSVDKPFYRDDPASVTYPLQISLVGRESPQPVPLNLSGSILYVPSEPADDPKVIDWTHNLLLVPRTMVTSDGSGCNKVGVSYGAFRRQGGVADRSAAGACLGNQLKQLHQADLARLAANPAAETDYLLSGKQLFKAGLAEMATLGKPSLLLKSPELTYSTLALEMAPSKVDALTYEAVGWIPEASATPFNSLTRQGVMNVVIENVGSTTADYIVALTGCQPGIEAVSPQARTIVPREQVTFAFPLRSSVDLTGSHFCRVVLLAPTGREYDRVQIFFATSAVSETAPDKLLLKNSDTTVKAP